MLRSTMRLPFRKAWSQRLTSSFNSRPLLQQIFPQAKAHLQPQARQVHEKARLDSSEDEIPPSSGADEDKTFNQLFAVFIFLEFVIIGSNYCFARQDTELFKQAIDSRDHEIRYLRDKITELQLRAKEPHAGGLEI
jgi:hypothetical protein